MKYDAREKKQREIKKLLVHKLRLKKNYYKLLENEGQQVPVKAETKEPEKKLTYQDRIKIGKDRKLKQRQEAIQNQKLKLSKIEESKKLREQRKEKYSKKTKRGQPLMGPRISDLLEKIKEKK